MSKEDEKRKSVLGGAAAAVLGAKAPKNVLGYEKVYHGTSLTAARSIRETGLKKSKSGSGVAANDVAAGRATAKEVRGKVYTSTNRMTADNHQPRFGDHKMGTVVSAKVPYRPKKRLARDHVFDRMVNGTDNATNYTPMQRRLAKSEQGALRIYKHSIPSRFIDGGHNSGGAKQFATKGNMRRYLSTGGGKARFAKGVAQAAGAGASAMYSIAHAIKARKEKS